jgi:AhpD family alkylhydroperoxidase
MRIKVLSKTDLDHFSEERNRLNETVFKYADLPLKRFFSLDGQTYRDNGHLSAKTKEMMGFVASLVLRCDDCVKYHTMKCHELGVTAMEYQEAANIALIVGGSIVIPHLRRAMEVWDVLEKEGDNG